MLTYIESGGKGYERRLTICADLVPGLSRFFIQTSRMIADEGSSFSNVTGQPTKAAQKDPDYKSWRIKNNTLWVWLVGWHDSLVILQH